MTQAIIRVGSQAELLAYLPALTGFTLEHSIVCVGFIGNRSAGAFRFDLPKRHTPSIAHSVVSLATRFPSDVEFVLVIYSPTPSRYSRLATQLRDALDQAGFGVRELLWQSETDWGSFLDGMAHRLELTALAPMPTGMNLISTWADADSRFVVNTGDVARRFRNSAIPLPNRLLLRACEAVLHDDASAADIALVASALAAPRMRDLVLMHWAFGQDAAVKMAAELRRQSARGDAEFAEALLGRSVIAPENERIALALTACHRFLALHLSEIEPPVTTVQAWLCWAVGETTLAAELLKSALRSNAGYGLAQLLDAYFASGAVPEWAFAHITAKAAPGVSR